MNLEELKSESVFQTLTEKQKVFVIEYCSNGADKEKAAEKAYPTSKSYASRMASAHCNLKVKKIAFLINKFYGYDPDNQPLSKEEFLGLISGKMRDPQCPANFFTSLASMYLRLSGWAKNNQPPETSQATEAEPEPEDIDDIVKRLEEQRGK